MVVRESTSQARLMSDQPMMIRLRRLAVLVAPVIKFTLVGVLVGVITGSPTAAAASAGLLTLAVFVWHNYFIPSRQPREPPDRG